MSRDHASAAAAAEREARIKGYRACAGHAFPPAGVRCRHCGAPRVWVAAEKKKEGER